MIQSALLSKLYIDSLSLSPQIEKKKRKKSKRKTNRRKKNK